MTSDVFAECDHLECDHPVCDTCEGDRRVRCRECKGTGFDLQWTGEGAHECWACDGTKRVDCEDCKGTGHREVKPLTELERSVLTDLVDGLNPWRNHQGSASRPISQAIGRLKRKGYLVDAKYADVPTDLGRSAVGRRS